MGAAERTFSRTPSLANLLKEYAMRMLMTLSGLLAAVISLGAQTSTQIEPNSIVYVEASDFGQALQAAIVKKKVPLLVTTDREKAVLFLEETSKADKEGTGERVAKVIALGVFAGSGRSYEASVTLTNRDRLLLWAHNSKKSDIRRAAEDVAERLADHLKKQAKQQRAR